MVECEQLPQPVSTAQGYWLLQLILTSETITVQEKFSITV